MRSWAVVVAQPRSELKAVLNLVAQDYDAYCPMVLESLERQGRRVRVERALFSRYLFVHIVDRWQSILGTRGVSSMIMEKDAPVLIEEGIIASIKARETLSGYIALPEKRARFKRGNRVRIERGPFSGAHALVEGMPSHQRVRVLMHLLGRETRVDLSAEDLAIQGDDGYEVPPTAQERFGIGDKVLIEHGPFRGAQALVAQILSHSRVIVSMGILGGTRVEVAADDLR